jgi:hypothetical protein
LAHGCSWWILDLGHHLCTLALGRHSKQPLLFHFIDEKTEVTQSWQGKGDLNLGVPRPGLGFTSVLGKGSGKLGSVRLLCG